MGKVGSAGGRERAGRRTRALPLPRKSFARLHDTPCVGGCWAGGRALVNSGGKSPDAVARLASSQSARRAAKPTSAQDGPGCWAGVTTIAAAGGRMAGRPGGGEGVD